MSNLHPTSHPAAEPHSTNGEGRHVPASPHEHLGEFISSVFSEKAMNENVSWGAQAGGLAMVIGGAGPWAVEASSAVQITQAPAVAALVVVGGIVNMVLGFRYHRGQSSPNALRCLIGIAALCVAASLLAFVSVMNTSSHVLGLVHPGWGLYLSFAASIVTGLCGLALLLGSAATSNGGGPSGRR